MSKHLNMKVVAEGVEKQEEFDFLRNGCDQYQGYLFFKPMPADEAKRLIDCQGLGPVRTTQINSAPEWIIYD